MHPKAILLVTLFALALGGLVACGGETGPAAPLPAAPTGAPLPTRILLPSTSMPAPATSTPGLRPATAAELALINQSLLAAADLRSFHYTQTASGSTTAQSRSLEGDYLAPDRLSGQGQASGVQGEFLKVGTHSYKKDPQGTWAPWTDPSETTPQTPQEIMHGLFTGLVPFVASSGFQTAGGVETLDGVGTQHFVGTIATSRLPGVGTQVAALQDLPPAGTIAVWIDPLTGNLHKLAFHLDTRLAMAAVATQLATSSAPTGVPSAPISLTVNMTLSRQNDPAIDIAAPVADAAPATTISTPPLPTDTAVSAAATLPPAPPTSALPAAPTAASGPATAVSTAGAIQIVDYVSFTDIGGHLRVIGYVRNTGTMPVQDITVVAQAADASGTNVDSHGDLLLRQVVLAPGAGAPFAVIMAKSASPPAKLTLAAQAQPFDPSASVIFLSAQGLSIAGNAVAPAADSLPATATGRVQNTGPSSVEMVRVLAIGYDAAGKFVDASEGLLDGDTIPPGGDTAFTVTFRANVPVTKVDLLAVGHVLK